MISCRITNKTKNENHIIKGKSMNDVEFKARQLRLTNPTWESSDLYECILLTGLAGGALKNTGFAAKEVHNDAELPG